MIVMVMIDGDAHGFAGVSSYVIAVGLNDVMSIEAGVCLATAAFRLAIDRRLQRCRRKSGGFGK